MRAPDDRSLVNDTVPEEFLELSGLIERAEESAERQRENELMPEVVAARTRRRRRRFIITGSIVLVIAAMVGTYIPLTLLAPVTVSSAIREAVSVDLPDPATVVLPEVGASAISIAGADDFPGVAGVDGILAATGGNDPRPIASITKIVTALVILDAKPIGPTESGPMITFSKADAALYDQYYVKQASIWPMKSGSSMPLRDALQVMLVISATNYADAVSSWAFGSPANFRSAARTWLDANGFTGTTIVEPTGLDPRNLSTPTDLIAIGKLAMANPVLAEIVGTRSVAGADGRAGANTNDLLGVDGVNGIKTGTLDESGACLLFSAVIDVGHGVQLTVVGVVLGGDNHYQVDNAVRAMLGSVRGGFHEVPVLTKGQKLGSYSTPWGEEASVVAAEDASVFTWSDMPVSSAVTVDDVSTARSGSVVGSARFVSGEYFVKVPLELDGDIVGPDDWWRLTHPAELLGG
ncbi:D-alanyl-D-alanine carboxypeptidase family protein [Homoserinimonas sp. A520]